MRGWSHDARRPRESRARQTGLGRERLNVKEGDYLEAHVLKQGVPLKPVTVVDRSRALAEIRKAAAQVKRRAAAPVLSDKEIAREVKRLRQTDA